MSRSAASKLTFETVVAAGPTAAATVLPTVIFRASALPVFRTGAVAVAGTAYVCPGWSIPEKRVAPPFSLTCSHTGAVAVSTTGPCAGAGAAAGAAGVVAVAVGAGAEACA